MPQPLWRRLTALPVERRRVVTKPLVERVSQLVKGGVIPKPLWYDAMLAHPPPPKVRAAKPRRLEYPEDRLRRVWLRRNPEATMHPKTLFLEEDQMPASHREHPADAFVAKQMALMRKGLGEEEAYRQVKQQLAQETTASPEAADALRAATAFGGEGGGGVQQELLRQFAEEARDAGMPYPEHWFDAAGNWVGVRPAPLPSARPPARPARPATDGASS